MKYLSILIFLFISSLISAQDNFLAYRVTGKVTYLDKGNQVVLKVGKILDNTASVKVGRNASLLLICGNTSVPVQLQEGTHVLGKLASSCHSTQQSLTYNYFNYVWWQLTHPKASVEEERKKNSNWPGAVSRGCQGIEFLVPDTLGFYRENIILKWKINVPFKSLEFVMYEYADSPVPLLKIPITTGYLHLESFKDKLEISTEYFWTLSLDGKENCPRKLLQVWSSGDFTILTDSINTGKHSGLDEAERDYMMGWMYEQNHLVGEASRHYKLAEAAAPGNSRYKKTVKRLRS